MRVLEKFYKSFGLSSRFSKQVSEMLGIGENDQLGKCQGGDFKEMLCWEFWCLMSGWIFVKKFWSGLNFGEIWDQLGNLGFEVEFEGWVILKIWCMMCVNGFWSWIEVRIGFEVLG